MNARKKKIVIWLVIVCLAAGIIGTTAYLLYSFLPRSMSIDWDSIEQANNGVTLLSATDDKNQTGSPALVKADASGNILSSEWKVLQFTDMHLTHELKTTNDTIAHFIDALNHEKPDFVVLTGDIVTRLGGKVRLQQLSEIFERAGIYWAYVLGNHEGDSDPYTVSREETMRIVSEYEHCLVDVSVKKTKSGEDVWGNGNYVVNLLGEGNNIVQTMIFMDSGNKMSASDYEALSESQPDMRKNYYDYLKESQMTWYEEQLQAASALNANVKSMLFIHIPLVEYRNLLLVKLSEDGMATIPAGYEKIDGSEVIVGGKTVGFFVLKEGWSVIGDTRSFETPCSSDYNNGMYARMCALRAHVNGVFCGHDHINNTILYEADESPIYLCYGNCSGIQGYNKTADGLSDGPKYDDRGYSVIKIHADSTFDFADVLFDTNYNRIARIVNGQPA